MPEPNVRVGAFLSATKGVVKMFGYGIYVGDEIPSEEAAGMMAEVCRELKRPNPKIVLDNGDVVYGCECWWGPEEKVKEKIAGCEIVNVSIADARTEFRTTDKKE